MICSINTIIYCYLLLQEYIYKEFDRIFNHPETTGTKIYQFRINPSVLRFNIVSVNPDLIRKVFKTDNNTNQEDDFSQLSPEQLLNDENIFNKLSSSSSSSQDNHHEDTERSNKNTEKQ